MRAPLRLVVLAAILVAAPVRLFASPVTIDFEAFGDSEDLTTQLLCLTFTNATVLTAGISLNEFEFPPASGFNAAFDNGGAMRIDFAAPVFSVGGFFTYLAPLTFRAYGSAGNLLGATSSAFTSNLALSGDSGSSPNEWLRLTSSFGISFITITGDPFGGSFALDDLTYDDDPASVPEANSLSVLLLGIGLFARRIRRLRRNVDK